MIEITTSYSGAITTGVQYENRNPMYCLKEIVDKEMTDEELQARQDTLSKMCRKLWEEEFKYIKDMAFVPEEKKFMTTDERRLDTKMRIISLITQCKTSKDLEDIGKKIPVMAKTLSDNKAIMAELRAEYAMKLDMLIDMEKQDA